MSDLFEFRQKYLAKTPEERFAYLKKLSSKDLTLLYRNPRVFLSDKQIPPETPWRYHMYRGGRGAGKTFASTSWLYEKIINGAHEVAIIGPTYGDLIKETLPTFESHWPISQRPHFNQKDNAYYIGDCVVKVYSSDTEVRGMNAEFGIVEELCKWCDFIPEKVQERFDTFDMGVRHRRAKPCPQIFISSTPRYWPIFISFEQEFLKGNTDYSLIVAETDENTNLSEHAKRNYHTKHDGKITGARELQGLLVNEDGIAYWSFDNINANRVPADPDKLQQGLILPYFTKESKEVIHYIVVAVDPAGTANPESDETGIVVAAMSNKNHAYILEDASGKYSANAMGKKVAELYYKYAANNVIIERNFGGDHVVNTIKSVDPGIPVKEVIASKGKALRAQPISAKYEQNIIHHVGTGNTILINRLQKLELQMCAFTGANSTAKRKDDRVDALVFALFELVIAPVYVQRRFNLPDMG